MTHCRPTLFAILACVVAITHPIAAATAATAKSDLLTRVKTIVVTPQVEFDADTFFLSKDWPLGLDFQKHFLHRKYKTDGKPVRLTVSTLRRHAKDTPIIEALGGLSKVEVSLPVFAAALISLQTNCERGDLTKDLVAHVAYIKDDNGALWG